MISHAGIVGNIGLLTCEAKDLRQEFRQDTENK